MLKKFYFVGGPLGKTSRMLNEDRRHIRHFEFDPLTLSDITNPPIISECNDAVHDYRAERFYKDSLNRFHLMVHHSVREQDIGDIIKVYGWFQWRSQ